MFFPETADIPDGSTVSGATLYFWPTVKQDAFGGLKLQVVVATPASESALVTGDFDQFGTTVLGEILLSDITVNSYNSITLNPSYINKTGTTILGLRFNNDVSNDDAFTAFNTAYLSIASTDDTDPGHRPFLTTTY